MTEIPPHRPDPLAADFGVSADAATGYDATHDPGTSMFGDLFGRLLSEPVSEASDAADPSSADASAPAAPAAPAVSAAPAGPAPVQAPPPSSTPWQPRVGTPGQPPRPGPPSTSTPWPTGATPAQVGSGCRKALLLLALFVIVPIAIAIVSAVLAVVDDDGDNPVSPTPSESQAVGGPVTPVPVPERSVAAPPVGATSVRFEVQGPGRVADVSVYRDGVSTRESDRALPWAVSVPITADSSYFNVRATDYGTRDAGPMQCRAYVGDVLVALNTGIERVECTVTSASFPRPAASD